MNGQWDIRQFVLILPWGIIHRISSIHAGRSQSGLDKVIWGWSNNGDFTVRSAFDGLLELDNNSLWNWKFIWKLNLPLKV